MLGSIVASVDANRFVLDRRSELGDRLTQPRCRLARRCTQRHEREVVALIGSQGGQQRADRVGLAGARATDDHTDVAGERERCGIVLPRLRPSATRGGRRASGAPRWPDRSAGTLTPADDERGDLLLVAVVPLEVEMAIGEHQRVIAGPVADQAARLDDTLPRRRLRPRQRIDHVSGSWPSTTIAPRSAPSEMHT